MKLIFLFELFSCSPNILNDYKTSAMFVNLEPFFLFRYGFSVVQKKIRWYRKKQVKHFTHWNLYIVIISKTFLFWQNKKETRKTCVCFSFVAAFFVKTINFFFPSSHQVSFVIYVAYQIAICDLFFTHSVSFSLFNFFEYYLMPFPFGSCSVYVSKIPIQKKVERRKRTEIDEDEKKKQANERIET